MLTDESHRRCSWRLTPYVWCYVPVLRSIVLHQLDGADVCFVLLFVVSVYFGWSPKEVGMVWWGGLFHCVIDSCLFFGCRTVVSCWFLSPGTQVLHLVLVQLPFLPSSSLGICVHVAIYRLYSYRHTPSNWGSSAIRTLLLCACIKLCQKPLPST